ncbi:transglutaminase domain-containing protein [Gaoshiqia sp. Z1-71]|uniref:transglutaminase domain-containing protein n=1 Tax=Gaoshiqia hydrogeniformans TaxID=3290090 RepID=UPI003BF7F457
MANIQEMLAVQKQLTANSTINLWSIFDHTLSGDEKQAMEFLYAYMPLSDLADYPAEFFLANVRSSLKAREELSWGKSVPEDLFLHFVLPVRINNENLDAFRIVLYDELKARVQDLDIEKAALEVNHWCHEKVVYRGTDSRTSAPLSTVRKAFGRCGEESTFTVSALRAVGIPARQVYTPRWAHSDDNHAWVEVWVNGTWKFLGACEPDPHLNMGWFTEPARRTLLVHTRAYGNYLGDEEALVSEERFSELNLTSNYAPVKKIYTEVRAEDDSPVNGAKVEFQLYNYADFYPIATQYTNEQGQTAISLGLGEIIVWASQDDRFAFKKISVSETDTVRLTLGNPSMDGNYLEFDFVPPHLIKDTLTVTPAEKELNERRLAKEDSIRGCYTATFKTDSWSKNLAKELRLDENQIIHAIQNSYGNWEELEKYLRTNAAEKWALPLLKGISAKDFSDTKASVLSSHLRTTKNEGRYPETVFTDYVLAPRIKNEMLLGWRPFLQEAFASQKEQFRNDPQALTRWIMEHIKTDDLANLHSRAPISPEAVYKLRVSDTNSREIFFVAVCRSLGIPARLNPATREPEYYAGGEWYRAAFSEKTTAAPETGKLVLKNGNNTIDPQYEIHFSIGKRVGGNYRQLEYPFAKNINEFEPLTLETGDYCLITGNRLEDGSVLSSVEFFAVEAGNTKQVTVNLRQSSQAPELLARIDLSALYLVTTGGGDAVSLSDLAKGKNIVLALLDPDKEPSKHILNDLADYIDHFEAWQGQFLFMAAEDRPQLNRVLASYKLPANRISGFDRDNMLLKALAEAFGDDVRNKLPLVILSNSGGQVVMFSSGYKIGIGEQLLKIIPALNAIPEDACCRP